MMARVFSVAIQEASTKVSFAQSINKRHLPFFTAIVLALLAVASSQLQPTATGARPQNRTVVVFAVSAEGGEGSMDAVAIVEGKRLHAPYNSEQQGARNRFAEQYFATGKVYRLIFGGGDAGTVAVSKWNEGCNNIHAQVNAKTSVRLGGKVMALATNSETLGKHSVSRRPPTDAERAAVLTLVKSIYQQNRTPASLMSSIKVTNLTATDLDGDGTDEMVGSFTLATRGSSPTVKEGSIKFERDLFLISKSQGALMKADFVKFQAYQPPPEGFLSSIDFVDQLDVDGDGTGEVFTTQGGFDGYQYLVFKRVAGRWRQVYDMIGDAC